MPRVKIALALLALLGIFAPSGVSRAQEFPSRLVRIVVPYPAGGGTDTLARLLADQLSRKWGQSAIVEVYQGVSLTIPKGTHFQFRSFGEVPLAAIGVTMPPWPGDDEAVLVSGKWTPTVP